MSTPARPAAPGAGARHLCQNCYAERLPGARYCHACGQSSHARTPSVRQLARDYASQYAGIEGALWRTLSLMLLRPGRLTAEYLRGRRRHYLHPIRLYLTASVTCFLVLQLNGLRADPLVIEQAQRAPRAQFQMGGGRVNIERGTIECEALGTWLCGRLRQRYAVEPDQLTRELQGMNRRFLSYFPYAMFALLPLFAGLMQLAYRNRRLHYAEHLVFALHLHSFWFVGFALIAVLPDAIGGWIWLALPICAVVAMRTVYGGRWGTTLARAAVVSPLYFAALVAMLAVVALVALVA